MDVSKLLPLVAIAGLGATQKDTLQDIADTIVNMVKVIAVEHELGNIRKAVMAEVIAENLPSIRADFPAFVRGIARSDDRDVAQDLWGHEYLYREFSDEIWLVSVGPDGVEETDDDVVVTLPTQAGL